MMPNYIEEIKHSLQLFEKMCFNSFQKLILSMCLKSLYTVIHHRNGSEELKCFLDKRNILEPAATTLIHMEELLISLNNFFILS